MHELTWFDGNMKNEMNESHSEPMTTVTYMHV